MQPKRRILTLALITFLSLFLLAACSRDEQTQQTVSTAVSTELPPAEEVISTEEVDVAEEPESAPEDDAQATSTGRTFKIVPAESQASYTVDEEFFSSAVQRLGKQLGFFTTVGVTNEVEGQIVLNLEGPPSIESGEFIIDISTLTSDDSRRDQRIRERFLESQRFPLAIFVLTGIEGLDGPYQEGTEVSFNMIGDLTIRETTNSTTFDVTATFAGDMLSGIATTIILMTDFNFDPPEIAGFMTSENDVLLTINFTAREDV